MIAKLGPGKILNYLEVDEILMNLCFVSVENADRKAIRQGKVGIVSIRENKPKDDLKVLVA